MEHRRLGTFSTIQSTLNVALVVDGVESASVAAGVVKNRNAMSLSPPLVGSDCRRCYVLLTTAIMGMIPDPPPPALRVSASPFGDAARMALGDAAGAILPSAQLRVASGSLGSWSIAGRSTAKAAADDGLFPPIFAV
ncbi:amino acid permease [Escherichia coli]